MNEEWDDFDRKEIKAQQRIIDEEREMKKRTLTPKQIDRLTHFFIIAVQVELASARQKFPSSECSLAALTEEVGELAKAALSEPMRNVVKEAIQVAVMACRVAVEGDETLDNYRWKNGFHSELFSSTPIKTLSEILEKCGDIHIDTPLTLPQNKSINNPPLYIPGIGIVKIIDLDFQSLALGIDVDTERQPIGYEFECGTLYLTFQQPNKDPNQTTKEKIRYVFPIQKDQSP